MLKQNFSDMEMLEFLNKIVFYHKATFPGMLESLSAGIKPIYDEVKKNSFLLKSIIKKE